MNIERYEIIEQIGTGNVGGVYRAQDPFLEREVAIKWLIRQATPQAMAQLRSENQMIADLGHAHIVPAYDLGEYEGRPFLVTRYLAGGRLDHHLPLELSVALQKLTPIADALDLAHHHQIIHQHLHPANILLNEQGQAYLTDFGLGQLTTLSPTTYQSPEQLAGAPAGATSDQYSLAVIIFEALTGRLPFGSNQAHPNGEQTSAGPAQTLISIEQMNSLIPIKVNLALRKALLKEPQSRYGSCLALIKALYEAAGIEPPAGAIHSEKEQKQLDQLYQMGLATMAAGQWQEAIAAFEQVTQIDPAYRNVQRLREVVQQSVDHPPAPPIIDEEAIVGEAPVALAPVRPSRRPLWLAAALIFLAFVAIAFALISIWIKNKPISPGLVLVATVTPKPTLDSGPTATLSFLPSTSGATEASLPTATGVSTPNPSTITIFKAGSGAKVNQPGQSEFQPLVAGDNLILQAGLELQSGNEALILLLPDDGKLSLDRAGALTIVEVTDGGVGRLGLAEGQLLVNLNQGQMMIVETPAGDEITIRNGPAGIILNDEGWEADCFSGPCVLKVGNASKTLGQCQHAIIEKNTITVAEEESQPERYFFSLFAPLTCPLPTPTPKPTASATPTLKPTFTRTPTVSTTTNSPTPTEPATSTPGNTPQPSPTQPAATNAPTPTGPPIPTSTPQPPTPTLPPAATPTPLPPPTATQRPPTNTPYPPTDTPEPPTDTPPPNPTRTPGPTDPPPPTNTPRPEPTETPGANPS